MKDEDILLISKLIRLKQSLDKINNGTDKDLINLINNLQKIIKNWGVKK